MMSTIIRTPSELESLKRRSVRRGLREVILDLPGDPEEIHYAEKQINESLNACGCKTGAVFVLAGLVMMCLSSIFDLFSYDYLSQQNLLSSFGLLLAIAVAGKVTGLAIAEWKLRATVAQIKIGLSQFV